jgi:hypothetical protein
MSGFKVSPKTVKAIGPLFTGDATRAGSSVMPYKKGWEICDFFKAFGCAVPSGSPSRWELAEQMLGQVNAEGKLSDALGALLHDREFVDVAVDPTAALEHANRHLAFDGLRLVRAARTYKLAQLALLRHKLFHPDRGVLHGVSHARARVAVGVGV